MINVSSVSISYNDKKVIEDLSLNIKQGEIVSIIGPNGSGKSTLLNSISRFLNIERGNIYYKDVDIRHQKNKFLAQNIASLSQFNEIPHDITVEDLVYYGRSPYKKWYESRNADDEQIVRWAMNSTGVLKYSNNLVSSLSGGERQRAFISMVLAQKPELLILDEPTTYLDIAHQLGIMKLIKEINQKYNITVIMVLHDLNQACSYSDTLIILKDGEIFSKGKPKDIMTEALVKKVYNINSKIYYDEFTNSPIVLPLDVC